MKRTIFFVLVFCVPVLYLSAQTSVKRLYVGDPVPAVPLDSLLNSKKSGMNLADFPDQLIILDQWNTGCKSCIELFPYMDSLQHEFGDQLKVFLLNVGSRRHGDDSLRIGKVFDRLEARRGDRISLPVIYANDPLDSMFPCRVIPQEVLIRQGKVIAITNPSALTRENIRSILAGTMPRMHMREDIMDFNPDRPLFIDRNGGSGSGIIRRSMLTGYLEGVRGNTGFLQSAEEEKAGSDLANGFYIRNYPLLPLLQAIWIEEIQTDARRVINESSNSSLMVSFDDTAYYHNAYCYELLTPPMPRDSVSKLVKEDIARYFPLRFTRETRSRPCWVLRKDPAARPRRNKPLSGEPEAEMYRGSKVKFLRAYPRKLAMAELESAIAMPFIDDTGEDSPLTVSLPNDLNDLEKMTASFKAAGYLLTREDYPLAVTVVRDR